jgi:uncharacterized membrane protein YheB (UPF0754 family)
MNIKELIKSIDPDVITEETATVIAEAFEKAVEEKAKARVELEVKNALINLDEEHAAKLQKLIDAIDLDHTNKLQQVVTAINENHAAKLKTVLRKYDTLVEERAQQFSSKLVGEISNYLDLYLEKAIPSLQLEEAVANTYAKNTLSKIKKLISIDPEYINENVKEALTTGKRAIDDLKSQLNESVKDNIRINQELKQTKAALILEAKAKDLPQRKKDYVTRLLSNKDAQYIEENFNYVVEMFEKDELELADDVTENATARAVTRDVAPAQTSIIEESVSSTDSTRDDSVSGYLTIMKQQEKYSVSTN